MSRRATILALVIAALGCCRSAWAQDSTPEQIEASVRFVDSLVFPDGPTIPVFQYESPLALAYFSTEFVAFNRAARGAVTVATVNNRSTDILTTGDLRFSHEPGLRMLLGRRINDFYAVEASYLGLSNWDAAQSVQDPSGNIFSPFRVFSNPAVAGLDFNNFVSARTATQFNTAELNLRRRVELPYATVQASGLCGFRYLNVHDTFEYRSRSALPLPAGTVNAVDVVTNNDMYGFQIGGTSEMHIDRLVWFSIDAKGAMLHNFAAQETMFTTGPLAGGGTAIAGNHSQGRVCFAGDLQAACTWKFWPSVVGRVGYQAVLIEGLALGSDNFMQNAGIVAVGGTQLSTNGGMTFHGPFGGLTLTW